MDFPTEITQVKTDAQPQRDGTIKRSTVVTFWLGKHGPFTERFDEGTEWDAEFTRRRDLLRQRLENAHR